jgi:hypothetical protein
MEGGKEADKVVDKRAQCVLRIDRLMFEAWMNLYTDAGMACQHSNFEMLINSPEEGPRPRPLKVEEGC